VIRDPFTTNPSNTFYDLHAYFQIAAEADNSDLKWRLQQLQTQYDYTVAKLTAQSENSKHSEVKLEVRTTPLPSAQKIGVPPLICFYISRLIHILCA
jgi:hypothetical protein